MSTGGSLLIWIPLGIFVSMDMRCIGEKPAGFERQRRKVVRSLRGPWPPSVATSPCLIVMQDARRSLCGLRLLLPARWDPSSGRIDDRRHQEQI